MLMPELIAQAHTSPCRGAYTQETRDVILSLDRATKTAPNGKQILKNVGVAMYLGAKIGFLGQNGAYAKCAAYAGSPLPTYQHVLLQQRLLYNLYECLVQRQHITRCIT